MAPHRGFSVFSSASPLRRALRLAGLPAVLLALASPPLRAADLYGRQLGVVELPASSCAAGSEPALRRGLALLHHMTYQGAREEFGRAAEADPRCPLALWGQAMTYVHPLWSDPPEPEEFRRAADLVERAAALPSLTASERAYVAALRAYFQEGRQEGEGANLRAFARGWQQAQSRFPDDPEIGSFHALAVLSTADPDDKTYRVQRRSAALASPVLRRIPDHPGAHHYLIHAHDYPPLAAEVLEVARSYGRIAPTVPHALHMPSHIFIRLGLWDEAITMNRRSADAALLHPVGGMTSLHYPHALDYLAYAHLQRGEDGRARDVLRELAAIDRAVQPHIAAAYALAAVNARLSLERGDWRRAAGLRPTTPPGFPWERFPAMRAITAFARALGAARSGQPDLARREIDRLAGLRAEVAAGSDYWGKQVEIMEKSARAWLLHAGGSRQAGLALMREAAGLESSTEKHPVTPGEVLPATELLGDMLLAEGRHADALRAYGQALARSPRRHNGLYGAGRAAELLGDRDTAARHYRTLLDATAAGATTPAVLHARRFLASRP